MKIEFYLLFVLCFISCASFTNETEDVKGKYILKSEEGYGEFVLNDNNTFQYQYAIGLIDSKSKGTWKKVKNEIILLSDSTYQNNKINVKELRTDTNPKFSITFLDKSPVVYANLTINNTDDIGYTTDELGKITLPNNTLVSNFTIQYLGETHTYTVKKGNTFIITLTPQDLGKTYFNNKSFELKRNKLIDREHYNWTYIKSN